MGQLHHWSWCLHQCCDLLGFTSKKRSKNPSLQNLHKLTGARAANKDSWEMANACVLPLYLPLSLLVSGEVLGEHNSHWWRKAREEKGFICQEEMHSRLWLGVINSTCCSEIWLWTGHIPLISLQLGDPSAGVDVNKSHSLYHLHCK